MEASAVSADTTERVNDLYWSSRRSVNRIAEELDLSKGALYALIEPLPTRRACPLCGSEVVHANRTAKDRGLVDCLTCDWDGAFNETEPHEAEHEAPVPPAPASTTASGARLRTIAGGALLGAAAGLALVMWARRR